MGVGKSTISHELSRLASRIEIDTDQWIEEKEGRAISDIFAKEGETYFRDLETSMIDELGMIKPAIISCGGGMALRELNVRKLQAIGTVVLLTAKPETIFERVRYNTNRPLLKDNMNVDYIRQMMEKRRVYYEHAATVTVSTDGKIITEIAKEILEKTSLSQQDNKLFQKHTHMGYKILKYEMGLPEDICLVALEHHENNDGSGYPFKLSGEQISKLTRVVGLCSFFDDLTSNRTVHKVKNTKEALRIMLEVGTKKFFPELLYQFVNMFNYNDLESYDEMIQ